MKRIHKLWLGLAIERKMRLFVTVLLMFMIIAAALNMYAMHFSLGGVGTILSEISRCENAQEAMQQETKIYQIYMRDPSSENLEKLEVACVHTRSSISLLPSDYDIIGAERFAKTWSVRNGYENYEKARDAMIGEDADSSGFVTRLYRVYDMQNYLMGYMQNLSQLTVQAGSGAYEEKLPMMNSLPYILLILMGIIFLAALSVSSVLSRGLVEPIELLAQSARRMAAGDFGQPEVVVENTDELGELVQTFNYMKDSTEENIHTLQENQKLSEQLHQEEVTRIEMEKQLDTTRLNLLQSQINPHFLFNTLNTIAGMAELENAETTDKMIRSLSSIFRYNLHTTDQFISLSQELKVVQDYMYLQQMRFGDRLRYRTNLGKEVNPDVIMIPVFLLQPLVENAIGHGVTKKEQGGVVSVSAYMEEGTIIIEVEDTGVGIPADKYRQILSELKEGRGEQVGIGIGNIYKRIHSIYSEGDMQIHSQEGEGTLVRLILPQDEKLLP